MSFILDAQKLQTFECWYCKSSQTTKASPNKEVCDGIKIDGGSKCWNNPSISYNSSSVTLTDKITKESYTFYLSRTKYKTIDSLVVDILNCVCKASGRGQAVTSIDINQINDSTIIFITNISRDTVIIPNKSVWVSSDSVLMQGSDPVAMACNFVKKCETSTNITWNNLTNEYYYVNEKNEIDTIGYSIGLNAYNIYHINHSGDTINKISTCDLVCPNTVSSADDNFTTNNCNVPFCNSVVGNDQLCDPGLSSISVVGLPSNGIVNINDNGYFCFTFTACDPDATYGYSYQITCPDGTSTTSVVSIDLTSTCPLNAANEDFVLGYKNNGININAAINDLPCSNKVYSLQTQPTSGILFFNQNGTGIYNPNSGFTGSDSCIVLLKCDGQSCDTSWLKIFVLENSPADSTYYLFAGQTITGDGSANDVPCTPPSTTTYNWTNTLTPSYAGTLTGTPSAWTYVSSATYCGDSYREYEQICTPPGAPGSKAKEMFKSVCASGVPDFETILDDTVGTFNVSSNDLSCTNGAATTWHLFQDQSFSGTKTHGNANDTLYLYSCKGNCPVTNPSPSDKIGHIHSWDTLTGNMTYYIPSTYEGDLCFKYIMRCRLPNGTWKNDDTVCVNITREESFIAFTQETTKDTSVNYDYTLKPSLRLDFDLPSCLNGSEVLQICLRTSPDDRISKGFGVQLCLPNVTGITNINSFIAGLNGADLRTWLIGKQVTILEQNYFDGTVVTTSGTKTIVNTAPTGAQIHIDKLACAHLEFLARIITPCVTVSDTTLIELPMIRYEGMLSASWMASGVDTYRGDAFGIPPYTPPTNFTMINPLIMDGYSYYGSIGGNQRNRNVLTINGVNYLNPVKDYYDLATTKNDVIAANIPDYIGQYLDLHYGGTFATGINNLNGELIVAFQMCGADKTNIGYCNWNSQVSVANSLANNTPAVTFSSIGCNYNYSRIAWRNLMNSIGLPYISSHTL